MIKRMDCILGDQSTEVYIGDDNIHSFFCQSQGYHSAEANLAAGTGYHCHFSCQAQFHIVFLFLTVIHHLF